MATMHNSLWLAAPRTIILRRKETAMTQKTDAGTAALAYYTREAAKPAPAPKPTPLDQMFGYYAA